FLKSSDLPGIEANAGDTVALDVAQNPSTDAEARFQQIAPGVNGVITEQVKLEGQRVEEKLTRNGCSVIRILRVVGVKLLGRERPKSGFNSRSPSTVWRTIVVFLAGLAAVHANGTADAGTLLTGGPMLGALLLSIAAIREKIYSGFTSLGAII